MKVLIIGKIIVGAQSTTMIKISDNSFEATHEEKLEFANINMFVEQWQLPKGCLGRNKNFQFKENELRSEAPAAIQPKLTKLWGKINLFTSIEEIDSLENEFCNNCKAVSSFGKEGRSICEIRGNRCFYLRLFKLAKDALIASSAEKN